MASVCLLGSQTEEKQEQSGVVAGLYDWLADMAREAWRLPGGYGVVGGLHDRVVDMAREAWRLLTEADVHGDCCVVHVLLEEKESHFKLTYLGLKKSNFRE